MAAVLLSDQKTTSILGLTINTATNLLSQASLECLPFKEIASPGCLAPKPIFPSDLRIFDAGIAYIEVQKGAYISAAIPLLVADKALAASEAVELLEAAADDQSHAGLITDLALMAAAYSLQLASAHPPSEMQYDRPGRDMAGNCGQPRDPSTASASMMASVSDATLFATARKLLQVACCRGAPQLIQYLLLVLAGSTADKQETLPASVESASSCSNPLGHSSSPAAAEPSAANVVTCEAVDLHSAAASVSSTAGQPHLRPRASACEAELGQAAPSLSAAFAGVGNIVTVLTAPDAAGMTLLHRAVQSGSAPAVEALLDGSRQLGIDWKVSFSLVVADSLKWMQNGVSVHSDECTDKQHNALFSCCRCNRGMKQQATHPVRL